MECVERPNRSDAHLPREEEAKLEKEIREHFDGLAPKRRSKPPRSDPTSTDVVVADEEDDDGVIPEYVEFQHLEESDSQKLVYNSNKVGEEFVETEYYKDLNCVDKQHHTTGTGFIKVDNSDETSSFNIGDDSSNDSHPSSKGNPATNDWIPADSDTVNFVSDKPRRSDN